MKKILLALMCISSLAFAAPKVKDPRIDVAKRATWNLLQDHLITIKPAALVAIKLIEQSGDFFLTQILVDADGENHVRIRQSFCFVLQVNLVPPEELQPNMAPYVVSYIENNNDLKNQFIQQCDNPPTESDLHKIKLLNEWPGIRNELSLDEQKSISAGASKPDNIK